MRVPCGELTKAGLPCKNEGMRPYGIDYTIPCASHRKPGHENLVKHLRRAHEAGIEYGKREAKWAAERDANEKARLEYAGRDCKHYRTRNGHGQLVVVAGYTYHWTGEEPLKVGDVVRLPGSYFRPETWQGEVTDTRSDYQGETKAVLSKVSQ